MLNLTPFLLFDGNCAEAMTFYQQCIGGELTLTKVRDTPMKAQIPAEKHSRIIYAHLKSAAIEFSATDWLEPSLAPIVGNTVAMYLTAKTYSELKEAFDKLAEGAGKNNFVPLMEMPFGTYGHFYDKFGVSWFFKA